MKFGVDMAEQGAWKEAQYRFERAAAVAPGDAEILNNLAVSYENNGLYAEAEKVYRKAIKNDAKNERIRSNYERFRVFYQQLLDQLDAERNGRQSATGDDRPPLDPNEPPPSGGEQ